MAQRVYLITKEFALVIGLIIKPNVKLSMESWGLGLIGPCEYDKLLLSL